MAAAGGLPAGWEREAEGLARAFLARRRAGGAAGPAAGGGGPGAAALRAAVLRGDVGAGEEQLAFLSARGVEVGRARFEVRRQAFYELLDRARARPAPAQELLAAVQALEDQASRDEFSELCYLMTLPSLQDSPDFAHWTVEGGRTVAVARLDRLLGGAGAGDARGAAGGAAGGCREGGAGRLEVLLRQAVSWQRAEARQRGVVSECHSLLQDPWDAPPPPRRAGGAPPPPRPRGGGGGGGDTLRAHPGNTSTRGGGGGARDARSPLDPPPPRGRRADPRGRAGRAAPPSPGKGRRRIHGGG